ncbi:RloB family protein [Plantactinospora sp. WMMB334]|uniref:RloB family protein n=1 Tax=Plantactinospora sp. WMMB334 TaxID=3404119 RepID=UPI003B950997
MRTAEDGEQRGRLVARSWSSAAGRAPSRTTSTGCGRPSEARRLGVRLAVSNPCFELWLLLHHTECRSHCAGYPDLERRLRRQLPTYDKARLEFRHYAAGVGDAVDRGRRLDPTGVAHHVNPSTGMWRLAELIMEGT